MTWQEVRRKLPQQWLLIEAITARSEGGERILEQIAVLDTFSDSATAMRSYGQMHQESPRRELYVVHTSRKALDITERHWFGIRTAA